jgi:D-alanyl-D-alanine carboxypeptidase
MRVSCIKRIKTMKMKMHAMAGMTLLTVFTSCQKDVLTQPVKTIANTISSNSEHPMQDSLQAIIDKYVAKGIPGIQVAVKNKNGLYLTSGGYASIETKQKIEPNSTGWLFSLTKTYTAALVMQQKERGSINLDVPIDRYLPAALSKGIPGCDKISVRMLLNHSSGIVNFTELPEFMSRQITDPMHQPTIQDDLKMIEGKPLNFEPGTDYTYSNSNYLLLQLVLEQVTGKGYKELLQTNIIEPLQLRETHFKVNDPKTAALGFPNYYVDRFSNEQLVNCSMWNNELANASYGYGGIAATATDAIRFFEALLNGKVVSDASLREMKTWITGKKSSQPDYGLGLEYFQYVPGSTPQFGHEGDGIGNSTLLLYVPDNDTYVFANCTAGRQIFGPYLFTITDFKNELSRYIARWRP